MFCLFILVDIGLLRHINIIKVISQSVSPPLSLSPLQNKRNKLVQSFEGAKLSVISGSVLQRTRKRHL